MQKSHEEMRYPPPDSRHIWLIFAISSIVFFVVLAIAPTKDFFTEWRAIQQDYNKYIKTLPKKIPSVNIGLRQHWNQELDRVDRCITCHLGIDNPAFMEAPQPFTVHPDMYHDVRELGCTTCHQGQGRATNSAQAHGQTRYWDKPMIPAEYLEASCGKCHQNQSVPDAPVLSKGRRLLAEYNCAACHKLGGMPQASFTPALDGVGRKTTRAWLVRWLKEPQKVRPETKMPDFKLSDEETNLLADFLMAQDDFPGEVELSPFPENLWARMEDSEFISQGKAIFRQARCISCHLVKGRGGTLAPELGQIGSKTNPEWLYNFLANPQKLQPGIPMPRYGFNNEERAAVVAYLFNEFRNWDWTPDSTAHVRDPDFYRKGMKIFQSYNCGGCHALTGFQGSAETGPDLTAIGDKPLYQIDFGRLDLLPKTRANFIYLKLKSPRAFQEDLRMPEFNLSEAELQAITTALLAQTSERLPDKYRVASAPESQYDPEGPFGHLLDSYSCLSCHSINGAGADIAPDLSRVGSALQPDWTKKYFQVPYSLRPIMTERMPNLFIPENEVEIIQAYFDLVLRDNAMDSVRINLTDTALVAAGRSLYRDGGCAACHQINGKGGYVGPQLDRAGERLTPGWVYHWLKSPRKYNPETLEPQYDLKDKELKVLTAYIMSLKGNAP